MRGAREMKENDVSREVTIFVVRRRGGTSAHNIRARPAGNRGTRNGGENVNGCRDMAREHLGDTGCRMPAAAAMATGSAAAMQMPAVARRAAGA